MYRVTVERDGGQVDAFECEGLIACSLDRGGRAGLICGARIFGVGTYDEFCRSLAALAAWGHGVCIGDAPACRNGASAPDEG